MPAKTTGEPHFIDIKSRPVPTEIHLAKCGSSHKTKNKTDDEPAKFECSAFLQWLAPHHAAAEKVMDALSRLQVTPS